MKSYFSCEDIDLNVKTYFLIINNSKIIYLNQIFKQLIISSKITE